MRENNKVMVIVVTCNRKRLLERCLNSIFSQTYMPHQVCIIDNASTDGTQDLVAYYQKQRQIEIKYIRLPENIGGAGGFSEGFRWALDQGGWDWLLVMDDDAAPDRDYVKKLLACAQNHPEVKCFTGTEYVGDTMRISYGSRRVIDKESTMRTVLVPKEWYERESFFVDTATFVGVLIHKDVVKEAGLPDASFFIYYDDTDYCFKIRNITKILHVTDARIIHREEYEKDVLVEGQKEWRLFYQYRNEMAIKKRYIKRWHIRYGWIGKNYVRKILEICKSGSGKRRKIWIITRATVDVMRDKLGKVNYVEYK